MSFGRQPEAEDSFPPTLLSEGFSPLCRVGAGLHPPQLLVFQPDDTRQGPVILPAGLAEPSLLREVLSPSDLIGNEPDSLTPVEPVRQGKTLDEILSSGDLSGAAAIRALLYHTVYGEIARNPHVQGEIGVDCGIWLGNYGPTGLLGALGHLYAIDTNPNLVALAQRRLGASPNFQAMEVDLFKLPAAGTAEATTFWPSGPPTVAILAGILDCFEDKGQIEEAFRVIVRALPSGSRIFTQTANRDCKDPKWGILRAFLQEPNPKLSVDDLERLMAQVCCGHNGVQGLFYTEKMVPIKSVPVAQPRMAIPFLVRGQGLQRARLSSQSSPLATVTHQVERKFLSIPQRNMPSAPYIWVSGVLK